MKTLDVDKAAAAFFELFKQHPELRQQPLPKTLDEALEPQAVALLNALARGDWSAWAAADDAVRSLASTLVLDLFAKLVMHSPEFAKARWTVRSASKAKQALEVLAHEIARSHPQQTRPH